MSRDVHQVCDLWVPWLEHLEHLDCRQLRCQLFQRRDQFVVSLGPGFHVAERVRIRDERRHGAFPYPESVERGSFVGSASWGRTELPVTVDPFRRRETCPPPGNVGVPDIRATIGSRDGGVFVRDRSDERSCDKT